MALATLALLALQWLAAAHVAHDCHGCGAEDHAHVHHDGACRHDPDVPAFEHGESAPGHHPADCPVCRLAHFSSLAGDVVPLLVRATAPSVNVPAARPVLRSSRAYHAHDARGPPFFAPVS